MPLAPRPAGAAFALSLLATLGGCSKMAVDGEIVDIASGEPVVGATVTAINSQCQTQTDAAGKFALACVPDTYDLLITAEGYIEESIEAYDASERKRYDVGKRGLVRIPQEKGFLLFQGGEYVQMERALLERRKGGVGEDVWKHYCLPEEGDFAVNKLAAGVQNFFDHEAPRWRPFRLDEERCAYKMFPNKEGSRADKVEYSQNPEFVKHQLKQGKVIVQMQLERGLYFIADWEKGFFTKVTLGDEKGYAGYLLAVQ